MLSETGWDHIAQAIPSGMRLHKPTHPYMHYLYYNGREYLPESV